MIIFDYTDLTGLKQTYDLDAVIDIIRGKSHKKEGWIALIVFDQASNKFIELRDSPPDPKGNSKDEAEEVDSIYITSHFSVNERDIEIIRKDPSQWVFIDMSE
jgi:hypothetical protein